jgi:hypothetical protein
MKWTEATAARAERVRDSLRGVGCLLSVVVGP